MNYSIRTTILVSLIVITILTVVVLTTSNILLSRSKISEIETGKAGIALQAVKAAIMAQSRSAQSIAQTIASDQTLMALLAEGNNEALAERLVPVRDDLKEKLDVGPILLTDTKGNVILRVPQPEQFGDNIRDTRSDIMKVNAEKRPQYGLFRDKLSGLGIRGIVPAYFEGEHIGAVDVGLIFSEAFGEQLFADLKERIGVELVLFTLNANDGVSVVASTRNQNNTSIPDVRKSLRGEELRFDTQIDGSRHIVLLQPITDVVGNTVAVLEIGVDMSLSTNAMNLSIIISLCLALFMVFIAIIVGIFMTRPALKALNRVGQAVESVSSGDTNVQIVDAGRKDEIGVVARSIEVFRDRAKAVAELQEKREQEIAEAEHRSKTQDVADQFEASVGNIIRQVSDAAQGLKRLAQSMSELAQTTTDKASAVSSISVEATSNVNAAASATEQMSASVEEIRRQAGESAEKAAHAASEADSTLSQVKAQTEAAQKVGSIIGLIQDVAEQTNLLALNATIEAARAGDAGKGFAVVASEVKELASQTAKATDEISEQIEAMQNATETSANSIGSVTGSIKELNDIAAQIASAVSQQGAATSEISSNIQSAAQGTSEVSENISSVSGAAEDTASVSSEVLSASGELSTQADLLHAEVEKFLQTIRSAA